jgi:hypothetical protein
MICYKKAEITGVRLNVPSGQANSVHPINFEEN